MGERIPLRQRSSNGSYVPVEVLDVLRCYGCQEGTVIVSGGNVLDPIVLHVYPAPGAGVLDSEVDERVASAYDEGMRCLGIGAYRAAAVMFRSALSLYVKDRGSKEAASERHLKSALKLMKADGTLHPSLWDWADHLTQLGNEGAHPEDYEDVTRDGAEGLAMFVRHLIKHEYEMPAELNRARAMSSAGQETDGTGGADSMVI